MPLVFTLNPPKPRQRHRYGCELQQITILRFREFQEGGVECRSRAGGTDETPRMGTEIENALDFERRLGEIAVVLIVNCAGQMAAGVEDPLFGSPSRFRQRAFRFDNEERRIKTFQPR